VLFDDAGLQLEFPIGNPEPGAIPDLLAIICQKAWRTDPRLSSLNIWVASRARLAKRPRSVFCGSWWWSVLWFRRRHAFAWLNQPPLLFQRLRGHFRIDFMTRQTRGGKPWIAAHLSELDNVSKAEMFTEAASTFGGYDRNRDGQFTAHGYTGCSGTGSGELPGFVNRRERAAPRLEEAIRNGLTR
jgi:hypothetical protein